MHGLQNMVFTMKMNKTPRSPHLNLKDSTSYLLGIIGVLVLLLFFGSTLTEEKEQNTWLTLKTQPISKWKLILTKYISLVIVAIVFVAMVIAIGLAIPSLMTEPSLDDQGIQLQYPQVLTSEDTFTIISTSTYIARAIVLFMCASLFAFSLALLINRWCKNSFTVLMVSSFTIILGYLISDMHSMLQSPINPFAHFRFSEILAQTPQNTDWLYPVFAAFWSVILLSLNVFVPEKGMSLIYSSNVKNPFNKGKTQNHLLTLWKINIFEWRKLKRKGLLLKVYVLLIFLILFGYSVISEQAHQKEVEYMDQLREYAQNENNTLRHYKEQKSANLEEVKDDPEAYNETKDRWTIRMKFLRKEIDKRKAAIIGYEQKKLETSI